MMTSLLGAALVWVRPRLHEVGRRHCGADLSHFGCARYSCLRSGSGNFQWIALPMIAGLSRNAKQQNWNIVRIH